MSFWESGVEAHGCKIITELSIRALSVSDLRTMVKAVSEDPSLAETYYYWVLRIADPGTSAEFTETLRWARDEIRHFYGE